MEQRTWVSPNGVTHTIWNGKCVTCGRVHPHPDFQVVRAGSTYGEGPANEDWWDCKNITEHEFGTQPHYCQPQEIERYSVSTREVIDSIVNRPGGRSMWYAQARAAAYAGRLSEAIFMRDNVDELKGNSPFANRPTIKRGPAIREAVNPIPPTVPCQCRAHSKGDSFGMIYGPVGGYRDAETGESYMPVVGGC